MRTLLLSLLALLLSACGGGEPAQVTVAFYGDSITSGTHSSDPQLWTPARWSPTPAEHIAALANVNAIDYSHDGASSAQARIQADASALVVIRFGVADRVRALAPHLFWADITRLVAEARALDKAVLLTGLTHTAAGDTGEFDAVLRERARSLGVGFVDVYALPFDAALDLADAIHPALGYSRRIGELVAAAIRATQT